MKNKQKVSVSHPGDIVSLVPYLLGFEPHESLVTVWMRDRRVYMTARVDLADVATAERVDHMLSDLRWNVRADELLVVAYSDDAERSLEVLGHVVDTSATPLVGAISVTDGKWQAYLCALEGCCPPGVLHTDATSPAIASAVFAGLGVVGSREEAVAVVRGPDESLRTHMNELLAARASDVDVDLEWLVDVVQDAALAGHQLTREEIARCLVELLDVEQRDALLALINAENAHLYVRIFGQFVAHAPALFALAPLCLLGMASWLSGEGAVCTECCRRMMELDPNYRMGRLLAQMQQAALPPSAWGGWGSAA